MICAWNDLLAILPQWLRSEVESHGDDWIQELRMRLGSPAQLSLRGRQVSLRREVKQEDINFVVQTASRYSPWAAASIAYGYITAQGGHRIGLCGETVVQNDMMTGMRNITSVCIRIARQITGIAEPAAEAGSVLILGKPGSGKTTLLRDLIRIRSDRGKGSICVVDERCELFPCVNGRSCFDPGRSTDILYGCRKEQGIIRVLRSMGPSCIAVDEITAKEDCAAIMEAAWNGVDLLATVHATGVLDLCKRTLFRDLVENRIFDTVLVMQPDMTWRAERMNVCI